MKPIINLTDDGFLEIEHPTLGPPNTRLSDDVAASATTSTVDNNDDFASTDKVVFGKYGQEKTEIVTLTSTTGNTTLGHTTGPVFAHSARDPISKTLYNQAQIYTSTSQTGTYAVLATVTLNFQKEKTIYNASAQTTGTWFKVKYYDGSSSSSFSDPVVLEGYTSDSLHSLTDEILEEYGDPDAKQITRQEVRRKLRASVRNLAMELFKTYPKSYRKTNTTQDLTSTTYLYDYPTRFIAFKEVWINLTGTAKASAYKVETFNSDELSGYPDTNYHTSDPRVYLVDTQWGIKPTPAATGKAWISYWAYPEEMTEENDTHGLPYGAKDALILYSLWRLWRGDDQTKADNYRNDFLKARNDWLDFVAQATQTKTRDRVEPIFGSELYTAEGENQLVNTH